jgi:DNA polymerase III epsilon subunit-like protein
MYLFFDTETNGMAKNFGAPPTDVDNWPRITQLAWQLYDAKENLISEKMSLIKPNGWTVPTDKFFIDNNMSTERCDKYGRPINEMLDYFLMDLENADYLVAHNIKFDVNVVGAEFCRLGVKPQKKLIKVCTMAESTKYCNIKGPRGPKWPSLTELHVKLFGKKFEGAHDALDDVKACAKSFFELKRLGEILKS